MTTIAPPSLTWPEWTDPIGQVYKPGDVVAYAYSYGHSAGLQFGIVDQINRYRKNGEEITERHGRWDPNTKSYLPGKPSCTVRVIPLHKFEDKWTVHKVAQGVLTDGLESPKTWQRPECIVKINIEIEEP